MAGAQVDQNAFNIATSVVLAVALITAFGRIIIRVRHFKRLFLDDGFFMLAIVALVAGTVMMHINFPLAHMQVQVTAGVQLPSPDFEESILKDARTQYAAAILLKTTVVAVKFSFLFFFRLLLQRVTSWYVRWWWIVFVICTPSSIVYILSNVIYCPRIEIQSLLECVQPDNIGRLNAVYRASTAIDIYTDILIVTIPVILLWKVMIPLKKKLAFGAVLCLSCFMIVCSIVSNSAADIVGGQVDATWVLLWLELESCTAVTTVSVASFRALFVQRTKDSSEGAELYPNATRRNKFETQQSSIKQASLDPTENTDEEAALGAYRGHVAPVPTNWSHFDTS